MIYKHVYEPSFPEIGKAAVTKMVRGILDIEKNIRKIASFFI